jgi:hypothetical protein
VLSEATHDTRPITGDKTSVVDDVVMQGGKVGKDMCDWYVQYLAGNAGYSGEDTKQYERSTVSTERLWETSVMGAFPGNVMRARPNTGEHHR